MKMKKLLAGVLSAAMVATMIPASMAFSGVSAAPEDSLVASYDLTTEEGRTGWTKNYTIEQITENNDGVTIAGGFQYTYDDNTTVPNPDYTGAAVEATYTIANPLGEDTGNGLTVVLDIKSTDTVNDYESMFSFSNQQSPRENQGSFFSISGSGKGAHYNFWDNNFADNVALGNGADLTAGGRFVFVVNDNNNMTMYCNGNQVASGTVGSADISSAIYNYSYFNLGATTFWGQMGMNVKSVSFYNSALSTDEVSALGTYTYEAVDPVTAGIGDGLISAYALEDSYEDLAGGAALTAMNGTNSFEDGGAILSANSNAVDQGLEIPSSAFAGVTDELTISIKLKVTTYGDWGRIFQFGTYPDGGWLATPYGRGNANTELYVAENGNITAWDKENLIFNSTNDPVITSTDTNVWKTVTLVIDGMYLTAYVDGEQINQICNSNMYAILEGIVNGNDNWIGRSYWIADATAQGVVSDLITYNRALSSEDVAALTNATAEKAYAQSIADDLNITMLGRQLGTTSGGQNGVRFVAGIDTSVTEIQEVTSLGWVYAYDSAALATLTDSDVDGQAELQTVTSPSAFGSNYEGYAYSLVATVEDETTYVSVLPCVEVTVNGTSYWFAYDGKAGNYSTEVPSADVIASVDANAAFAGAGV